MKIKQTKFFILGLLGILASLFVIFIKISPLRCCGCPPEGYMLYPLILALIENRWAWAVDCVCLEEGCVKTFYIIPIDLLVVSFGSLLLSFTNIKISFSKALLVLFLVVLLGVGLLIPILLFNRTVPSRPPSTYPIKEVMITTDKTEYEQGETVKITIRNGLDKSIFGGFGHCGGLPFWGLQKFDNGDWRDLDFSLPYSEKEKEVCDLILCEREEPAELKSGLTIEDRWHLTSICEWPEKPIGVPKTEPKPIEEGTYRVRLFYGLNRREFDLLETNTIYSNEFTIQEK